MTLHRGCSPLIIHGTCAIHLIDSATLEPGINPVPGSQCDECTVNITLPFSARPYGTNYSVAYVSSNVEIGLVRAGDCNNTNNVNAVDFNILRASFGKALGETGYDARADFNRDNVVNSSDFNLLRGTFGQSGAAANCP